MIVTSLPNNFLRNFILLRPPCESKFLCQLDQCTTPANSNNYQPRFLLCAQPRIYDHLKKNLLSNIITNHFTPFRIDSEFTYLARNAFPFRNNIFRISNSNAARDFDFKIDFFSALNIIRVTIAFLQLQMSYTSENSRAT